MPDETERRIDPLDRAVGERLRHARLIARLSQTQLAGRVGLSLQQIQKYEYGTNRIAVSTLIRLADALGCRVETLVANLSESAEAEAASAGERSDDPSVDRLVRGYLQLSTPAQKALVLELVEQLRQQPRPATRAVP